MKQLTICLLFSILYLNCNFSKKAINPDIIEFTGDDYTSYDYNGYKIILSPEYIADLMPIGHDTASDKKNYEIFKHTLGDFIKRGIISGPMLHRDNDIEMAVAKNSKRPEPLKDLFHELLRIQNSENEQKVSNIYLMSMQDYSADYKELTLELKVINTPFGSPFDGMSVFKMVLLNDDGKAGMPFETFFLNSELKEFTYICEAKQ